MRTKLTGRDLPANLDRDPTELTQQAVDRSLSAYRREMEVVISGISQELQALHQLSKAETKRVHDVHDEKFEGVWRAISERDRQTIQLAADTERQATKLAADSDLKLNAALAAQKEAANEAGKSSALAIGKSESATKEQQNADRTLFNSRLDALSKEVADLRRQVDKAPAEMAADARTEKRLDMGQVMVAASLLLLAIGLVISAFALRGK